MELTRRNFVVTSGLVAAGACAATAMAGEAGSDQSAQAGEDQKQATVATSQADARDFAWPGDKPEIEDADISETIDTEILICGAGHSGMIAAVSAATEGAKVVVLEKNGVQGTTRSYIGAIGSRAQKELGVEVDKQGVVNDLVRYASGRCNANLINLWANESGAALNWLEDQVKGYGIEMRAEPAGCDETEGVFARWATHHRPILSDTFDRKPDFSDTGAMSTVTYWVKKLDQTELNNALVEIAQDNGADFHFSTPLVQLVGDENGVTGAIAQKEDGSYLKVNASKGVILCCGGYAADPVAYSHLDYADYAGTSWAFVQSGCTGDGIRAGLWAGAAQDPVPAAMLFDRGGVVPGAKTGIDPETGDYTGYPVWYASQPWLKLDLDGKRFCNESAPYDISLHALGQRKDHIEVILFDANAWSEVEAFNTISCSRLVESPTEPPTGEGVGEDVFDGWVQEGIEMGLVFKEDTIEKLAEDLQIPVDATVASVERYNAAAKAGVDDEFGKPAKDLFALDNPPYYGVRVASWVLCTLDGLQIDEDCRVLNEQTGEPIPGLYACGNNSGSFFSGNYPELVPGVACGRGMTEARHATLLILDKLDEVDKYQLD